MGLFRATGDNSKANTISDKDWRALNARASNDSARTHNGRNPGRDGQKSAKNLHQARKGNN